MTAGACVDAHHLVGRLHRCVLALLEEFHHPVAAVEPLLRGRVEVGTELGKGLEFPEARQVKTQAARNLLHRLRLGGTADSRHRNTGVHRRPLACEEQVRLQIDLPVSDRDHVGRDVGRNLPFERLNDRQRRERAAAEFLGELGRPLQQSTVRVKHVARVGLAAWRPPHQQRELAIGRSLLREIVVDDQRVLAVVHEVLGHRRARVGGDVLQRSGGAGPGDDHRRVIHRTVLAERVDGDGHRRVLLAHGDVEALHAAVLLVDDRVDADRRLARLAVANDQLALAAADRRHSVDGLDARLHWLANRRPLGHAGGERLHRAAEIGDHRPLAVERVAERIEHAADHRVTHRYGEQPAGALHLVPLSDLQVVAENDHADRVLFEIERQADDPAGELDHFACHHAREAPDAGDAVAHLKHAADLPDVDARLVADDFLAKNGCDFVGQVCHEYSRFWMAWMFRCWRRPPSWARLVATD